MEDISSEVALAIRRELITKMEKSLVKAHFSPDDIDHLVFSKFFAIYSASLQAIAVTSLSELTINAKSRAFKISSYNPEGF